MKKIIISTVVLALVLCIGISALVLALIPVGANDKVEVPHSIYVYSAETKNSANGRKEYSTIEGKDEQLKIKNKIYNAFNHGFQQKALAALFKGELNLTTEVDYSQSPINMSKNLDSTNKFTVVFYYKTEQKVKYGEKEFAYQYLFFEVSSNNSRQEVVMGLKDKSSFPNDASVGMVNYNYSLKTKANFTELYNYLSDLVS